jgi:hypothetical protein
MDKETFYNLMYQDWYDKHYVNMERHCEDPLFDKVWDIAKLGCLYAFFYPFGIGDNRISDASEVFDWLRYCFDDDGYTSIVIGRTTNKKFDDIYTRICKSSGKESDQKKLEGLYKPRSIIFLMRGDCDELSEEDVKRWTLYHGPHDDVFHSFTAKNFNEKAFDSFYVFRDRFETYNKMTELEGKQQKEARFEYVRSVIAYRNETDKLIEQMIERLK